MIRHSIRKAVTRHSSFIILSLFMVGCATPTPSQTVTPTRTVVPTNTPTTQPPTATPTPIPTPTPKIKQLTSSGCCVQPFWMPDSSMVLYVDKPNETASAGVWGVKLNGELPQLITSQIGNYSPDFKYVAYPKAAQTIVAEINGSKQWVIHEADGRSVSFSPDSKLVSWQISSSLTNFDLRTTEVWIANVDGTKARKVASLFGGGASSWFKDSVRMLATVRKDVNVDPMLSILNLADGKLTPITQANNFRGTALSPEGGWLLYSIAFSGDATKDGLWVMKIDGTGVRKLNVFGSYRWRSEGKILLVPLENTTGSQSHRFVEVDATTGNVRNLTDPKITPFRIANGDWSLAPDGKRVVFLNAEDRNLWVLDLP